MIAETSYPFTDGDGDIVTVGAHILANKNSWGTLDDFALCLE